jgi:hypothetical protein
MKTSKRIGPAGKIALAYIASHPGCCAAEVDRAVRTARKGHKWMYNTIARLVKNGYVHKLPSHDRRCKELHAV